MLTRTQKDIIRDLYIEERETGYCSFDFDDHHHDLRLMGELLELALFWDEENEEWYFSIVDVFGVLTESKDSRKYWNKLKQRLNLQNSIDKDEKECYN